ncbi:MAG: TonB-dependent receptor [Arcicella sp.]|jgi:outer membrane receptor protein involved in Fe transport|nr:TonB-dependent receptor [Arcicella sp.]
MPTYLKVIFFIIFPLALNAQTGIIRGKVTDEKGQIIANASVQIVGSGIACLTDSSGSFILSKISLGQHKIEIKALGYFTIEKSISVNSRSVVLDLVLKETSKTLVGVTVIAPTLERELLRLPENMTVVNTTQFYKTNQGVLDVLRRTSGIKIRTNGGYGARTDFYINGISGKQIKFFLDGVPLSALGETQSINIVPLEQTSRFEIYKGVIPIRLGSDALGGAVNIVSRNDMKDYLDVSTSISSFQTTKNNLNVRKYITNNQYVEISSTYNYARNNYPVLAEVPDEFGSPVIKNVRRFHNRYQFYNTKLSTGWVNKPWADQFSIMAQMAETQDEIQNNVIMRQPYGQAKYGENLYGGLLRYTKRDLFKNIHVNTYLSYSNVKSAFTDTTLNVYNWEGLVVDKRFSGGEISTSGNLLKTKTDVLNTQQSINWTANKDFELSFSNSYQQFYRTGNDPFAFKFYGFDFYNNPQKMVKNITGLSTETKFFNERLINISSIKYFYSRFSGNKLVDINYFPIEQRIENLGYNTAFTFFINQDLFVKASYEKATRLPDETEAFGDLMLIRPNPTLIPELSDNYNFNLVYHSKFVDIEASLFYRNISQIIYLRTSQFYAQYQNLLNAISQGAEANIRLKPHKSITLEGNITVQDLRNRSNIDNAGINNERYFNARLPNVPYLFANGGITFQKDSLFHKTGHFQVYWNCNYVHDYYLYWEVDGDKSLKNSIPTQFVNNLETSFTHYKSNISFSFGVNNIFDNLLYDNFKVQLPPRNYHLKMRFYISPKRI